MPLNVINQLLSVRLIGLPSDRSNLISPIRKISNILQPKLATQPLLPDLCLTGKRKVPLPTRPREREGNVGIVLKIGHMGTNAT
jgi:hypothetical protein